MTRITDLTAKLQSSLDPTGKPRKGYKTRVIALRREIALLKTSRPAASK